MSIRRTWPAILLATVLTLSVAAARVLSDSAKPDPAPLPAELQGIWDAVSGEEEGKPMKFAHGDGANIGECVYTQMIVVGDRWIDVEFDGKRAEVLRVKLVATRPANTLEVQAEEHRRFIYRVEGDRLTLCYHEDDDKVPTEFTAKKGSRQGIIIYKRGK